MKLFPEIAGRSAASLLAVGQDDDEAGLVLVIEHFGGVGDGRRQGRLAGRRERVHLGHDALARIGRGFQRELHIALLIGPRPIDDEPDPAEAGDGRQHALERGAHLLDARLGRGDALIEIAGHRPRGVEHEHGVFGARGLFLAILGVERGAPGKERRERKRKDGFVREKADAMGNSGWNSVNSKPKSRDAP